MTTKFYSAGDDYGGGLGETEGEVEAGGGGLRDGEVSFGYSWHVAGIGTTVKNMLRMQ